ncbi:MAG: hypothetical protein EBY88_02040, partial [Actinobacteria bacterium]|nr:hypothetical protein [Actinomycetota bacterium]
MALVSVVARRPPSTTLASPSVAPMSTLSSHDLSAAVSPFFGDLGSKYMLDPATAEIGKAAGYPDGFAFYMAGRGGVLGDVDADVVYAAFAFFDRGVVRKMWERGVAVEGAQVDFETALRIESRWLTRLATGQVAKNMIQSFFFHLNEIKADRSRPQGEAARMTMKLGILGAGMMGSGIAWAAASRGMSVVLKDVSREKAEHGKAYSARILAKRVESGKMSPDKAQAILQRIQATDVMQDLSACDMVIEAVYEDQALKAKLIREALDVLGEATVFASNTSTIPITELAKASARPEQFIGVHFFSPVEKMPLIEIIRGKKTNDATLAKAYDFVKQIGKTIGV